jgi:hypothetical protein
MTTDRTLLRRLTAAIAAIAAGAALSACSATVAQTTTSQATTTSATTAVAALGDNVESHADANDVDYDAADATTITLADGASKASSADGVTITDDTITITAPGTYILTGTLSDGQVVVDSDADGKVRLVLDGASVTNTKGSALVITAADEAVVVLADGSTNSLADGSGYDTSAEDAPNAALFSMADLTIGGTGALTVTGNTNDGISSKDGLVILGGTITVTAKDDGVRGKDYLVIADGTVKVTAGGDGLKSDNEDDDTVGYLLVQGGTVEVSAHAEGDLAIEAGTVTIAKSNEGLEGATVTIAGGNTSVTASDDGVNATSGTAETEQEKMQDDGSLLTISGGTLVVNADGDGLDSNGALVITGGSTVVHGPTADGNGALDSNGGITITGGTLVAAGSAGMAESPGSDSTTGWLAVAFSTPVTAGQTVEVVRDGTVVATYTAVKEAATLVVADADIATGESYEITVAGSTVATVTAGEGLAGGMGGGGMGGGRR